MSLKKKETKESAVSPVVGVMLMLVVTIIIAAVVAAFAGGLAAESEVAPAAVLSASVDTTWSDWNEAFSYGGNKTVFITSLSGEPIDLKKLSVTVYNASGASKKFSDHSHGYTLGDYLDSGETLNVGHGSGVYLEDDVIIKSGESVQVVVTYDNKHVLYDKMVKAL